MPERLQKILSRYGVTSRRGAEALIAAGRVRVNGGVAQMGDLAEDGQDRIEVDGVLLTRPPERKYLLLNKPRGYVTTLSDEKGRKTAAELVADCGFRVYPVGRLDQYSEGLLLLTNDGDLAEHLCHPRYNKQKIYQVTLDRNVSPEDIEKILSGIELEDGMANADEIEYSNPEDKSEVGVVIHSGRNRIVRRMFEALNYKVKKLDRVYYAGLTKKNLPRGKWRFLTDKEVAMLKRGTYK